MTKTLLLSDGDILFQRLVDITKLVGLHINLNITTHTKVDGPYPLGHHVQGKHS